MVVIVTGYTLCVTSQYFVIFTFANQRFGEVCWHSLHIQGRRSSVREAVPSPRGSFEGLIPPNKAPRPIKVNSEALSIGGVFTKFQNVKPPEQTKSPPIENFLATVLLGGVSNKTVEAMETYKKIVTNYVCFYSATMLTSKIITEMIKNHSEKSECRNSCNKFVSSRSW